MRSQPSRLLYISAIVLIISACKPRNADITPPVSTQTPTLAHTPTPSPTAKPTTEPTLEEDTNESFRGIYLVEPSGNNLRLITEPGIDYNYPQFSPNGQHIAFARTEEPDRALVLYNRQTKEMTTVMEDSRLIRELAWSSDSKRIAFSLSIDYFSDPTVLCLYELSTGVVTTVADNEGDVGLFPWSPDGKRLVYVLDQISEGPSVLRICDLRTKRITTIVEDEGDVDALSWSPDGKRLAFVLRQLPDGPSELRVYEPDANVTAVLLTWEGWVYELLWSPNSERLAFGGAKNSFDWRSFSHKGEVYTISARGGSLIQLTSYGSSVGGLSWSPTDEKTLAYVLYSDKDQFGNIHGDLHLIDPIVPNSQTVILLKNIIYLGRPLWSPDGQHLAIGTYDSGFLIDMNTLLQTQIGGGTKKWSPDGTAMLIESIGGGVSMVAMRTIYWIAIEEPRNTHYIAEDFVNGKPFWRTNADWAPDMELIAFTGRLNAPEGAP